MSSNSLPKRALVGLIARELSPGRKVLVDELLGFFPRVDARLRNLPVRAVAEADRIQPFAPKCLHICRGVFNVQVGTDLFLLFYETQIPVRNSLLVKPIDGLAHGRMVDSEGSKEDVLLFFPLWPCIRRLTRPINVKRGGPWAEGRHRLADVAWPIAATGRPPLASADPGFPVRRFAI